MHTVVDRRKQGYESYLDNRRFEEKTDISERVSYPIDITIPYEMRGDAAFALTDTKDRPFHEQTRAALEVGQFAHTGDELFQVERLRLEHDEALMVDALGRGELPGNVLIKFSKVPDAIVHGETQINGYRRDILRSFVRVYYREGDSVKCRLFTLDANNTAGLAAVGGLLGIDTLRPSEEVLATPRIMDIQGGGLEDFVDSLVQHTKQVYDDAVYAATGEQTYAGSKFADSMDAMRAIDNQPHLFEQHWRAVSAIMAMGLNVQAENQLLDDERKRTAAAIVLATRGETVYSNTDASVTIEVETGNYDGDCPTNNGMNQAALAETRTFVSKRCPICGRTNVVTSIEGDIISGDCGCKKEICSGKLLQKGRSIETQPLMTATVRESAPRLGKEALAKARYGRYIRLSNEITIGSAHTAVYDRRTGEFIDTI